VVKRIFGFLLFAWMVACLAGLIGDVRNQVGTRFWMDVGVGVFVVALGLIGLQMVFGKGNATNPPDDTDSTDSVRGLVESKGQRNSVRGASNG